MHNEDNPIHNDYLEQLSHYYSLPFYNQPNEKRYLCYKSKHEDLPWIDVITYVNLELDSKFYTHIKPIQDPDSLTVLVNKYNQLSEDYIPEDLEEINPDCSIPGLVLRHAARIAFEKMCSSAKQNGVFLKAISTFRCYTYQKEVYFRKKTPDISMEDYQKERDKVSARPGHSEHQTGLAVDINDLEESFEQTPEGKWLAANSFQYGFILRYPKGKELITGYNYEPWHFRYVGLELARAIYSGSFTYDEYYVRYLQLYLQCNQ